MRALCNPLSKLLKRELQDFCNDVVKNYVPFQYSEPITDITKKN